MQWWLLIDEFGPIIEYIKGPKNLIANMLNRLNMISLPSNVQDIVDCYRLDKDDLPSDTFPITYQLINHEQNKDKTLLATAKGVKHYTLKEFHGGDRSPQLLCYKNRIVIPKGLQNESCNSITTLYATQESIKQKNYHSTFLSKTKQKKSFPRESHRQMPWSSMRIRCSEI